MLLRLNFKVTAKFSVQFAHWFMKSSARLRHQKIESYEPVNFELPEIALAEMC